VPIGVVLARATGWVVAVGAHDMSSNGTASAAIVHFAICRIEISRTAASDSPTRGPASIA
jgi:hypothetical protein